MHQATQKMVTLSEAEGGLGVPVRYLPNGITSIPSQIDGPSCTDYRGTNSGYNLNLEFDAPKLISKILLQKRPGVDAT